MTSPLKDVLRDTLPSGSSDSSDYRFLYLESGALSIVSKNGSRHYQSGDVFLLFPRRSYELSPKKHARALLLTIDANFFEDQLPPSAFFSCDSTVLTEVDFLPIKRLLLKLADAFESDDANASHLILGNLHLLCGELSALPRFSSESAPASKNERRVRAIAEYIDEHYAEPLSLTDLADAFYLTPQYLSNFFKENFRSNFKTYLTEKRLFFAAHALRNTELPIADVAAESGFQSMSAFRRGFEATYHTSPISYRLNAKKETVPTKTPAPEYVPEDVRVEAKETPALSLEYTLAASGEGASYQSSAKMVNIGSAKNLLSEKFRKRLLRFCREFETPYVRLMDLIGNAMIPMTLPAYDYYFEQADAVLSFLYDHRLTPFIELSRLPFTLPFLSGKRQDYYYIRRTERYEKLFLAFLSHVSKKWTADWLSSWRFELAMQPKESIKHYLTDFQKYQGYVKEFLPDALFGGVGYDGCAVDVPLDSLLSGFQEAGGKPDFFSVALHCYEKRKKQGKYTLLKNADDLIARCKTFRDAVRKAFPKLPFYVTEWTSADFLGLPIAHSRFQAAFFVKTQIALDRLTNLSAYWLFSDADYAPAFTEREPFSFGFGLIDERYDPVPAYYAYQFTRLLSGRVASRGRDYCFFTDGANRHQLIAYHYAHFRSDTDPAVRSSADFDRVYELFTPQEPLALSFHFEGLAPGVYHVRRLFLDEYHGSLLDIMIGEFSHSGIEKLDFIRSAHILDGLALPYRREGCLPDDRNMFVRVDGRLTLSITLPAHAVCLWELKRQV